MTNAQAALIAAAVLLGRTLTPGGFVAEDVSTLASQFLPWLEAQERSA